MNRESDIQADILAHLGALPDVRLWRANVGVAVPVSQLCCECRQSCRPVRYGVVGQADLSGIRRGQRIEIEVKNEHGRTSEAQDRFGRMIRTHGGLYVVARSVEEAINGIR